jgi:hypothetical protein
MYSSRSFQLPSGIRVSQITTEISESARCAKACSQSGECRTVSQQDAPSSILESTRFSDGETTRTVSVAAFEMVLLQIRLEPIWYGVG